MTYVPATQNSFYSIYFSDSDSDATSDDEPDTIPVLITAQPEKKQSGGGCES